jgi:hypothetical protein
VGARGPALALSRLVASLCFASRALVAVDYERRVALARGPGACSRILARLGWRVIEVGELVLMRAQR